MFIRPDLMFVGDVNFFSGSLLLYTQRDCSLYSAQPLPCQGRPHDLSWPMKCEKETCVSLKNYFKRQCQAHFLPTASVTEETQGSFHPWNPWAIQWAEPPGWRSTKCEWKVDLCCIKPPGWVLSVTVMWLPWALSYVSAQCAVRPVPLPYVVSSGLQRTAIEGDRGRLRWQNLAP